MSGEPLRKKTESDKYAWWLRCLNDWFSAGSRAVEIRRCSLAGGQMPRGGFKARFPAQSLLLLPFVVQVVSAQLGVPTTRLSLHHHGP